MYRFTGIVYTGISEVVNDSNIDILIGALIKNQQGQNQLKSINILKEMFLVFYYGLLAFKGLPHFEEVTEY